jgi:hypothetical protein
MGIFDGGIILTLGKPIAAHPGQSLRLLIAGNILFLIALRMGSIRLQFDHDFLRVVNFFKTTTIAINEVQQISYRITIEKTYQAVVVLNDGQKIRVSAAGSDKLAKGKQNLLDEIAQLDKQLQQLKLDQNTSTIMVVKVEEQAGSINSEANASMPEKAAVSE